MNTFEVSILIADLTILIAGFAMFKHFNKRQKKQEKSISYLNEIIFEVESTQRYERKFEMGELKNKLELLEVKVSKATFDISEFKFVLHTKQQAETLVKNVMKSMAESKSSSGDDSDKKETKPSESVQNEVVDLIKDDLVTIDEVTQQTELNFQEKPKRKPRKKEVKTNITAHQIESSFLERYGMTYYGYRKMYGEKMFIKAKNNAYMRVYYKQITKKETK